MTDAVSPLAPTDSAARDAPTRRVPAGLAARRVGLDRSRADPRAVAGRLEPRLSFPRPCCLRPPRCSPPAWRLTRSGELPANIGVSFLRAMAGLVGRRRRSASRSAWPTACRSSARPHQLDAADGAQRAAPRADPAGHRLVRHRRGGEAVPGRARRVLPGLRQHAARRALGRSAADRNGAKLRHGRAPRCSGGWSSPARCRRSSSACASRSA